MKNKKYFANSFGTFAKPAAALFAVIALAQIPVFAYDADFDNLNNLAGQRAFSNALSEAKQLNGVKTPEMRVASRKTVRAAAQAATGDTLLKAVQANDLSAVKAALASGADANTPEALGTAAYNGNMDIARLLISSGAQVNQADPVGFTPLMMAAIGGKIDMAKFLVSKDAALEAKETMQGDTALFIAVLNGQNNAAAYLLSVGADATIKDCDGYTILASAMLTNLKLPDSLVKALISKGLDINAPEKVMGNTALSLAVDADNADNVRQMLANGANPALKDIYGNNALVEAVSKSNYDLVPILQEAMKKHHRLPQQPV